MPRQLDKQPDMTLTQEGGWWYRAGLHDPDFCTIVNVYNEDCYRLMDCLPTRQDEIIVDVGACIGAFSRLAHLRNPRAKIVAVEANLRNIPCLAANVGDFATVIPKALTYESEMGMLDSIYEGTDASGGSMLRPMEEVKAYTGEQYISVTNPLATVTLETIISENAVDFIDVLKLDCEASEYSILRDTTSLNRIRVIVGEFHDGYSRWCELIRERFSPADWFHLTWNHHDHMGLFILVNRTHQK